MATSDLAQRFELANIPSLLGNDLEATFTGAQIVLRMTRRQAIEFGLLQDIFLFVFLICFVGVLNGMALPALQEMLPPHWQWSSRIAVQVASLILCLVAGLFFFRLRKTYKKQHEYFSIDVRHNRLSAFTKRGEVSKTIDVGIIHGFHVLHSTGGDDNTYSCSILVEAGPIKVMLSDDVLTHGTADKAAQFLGIICRKSVRREDLKGRLTLLYDPLTES